jgi:hypothetical protein
MPVRPLHSRVTFVVLLLAAITLAVTWPLASRAGSALPGNLGDPLLNTWTLGWGSDRLASGLQGFWDGRAFYPHPDTVAFSEHLLGIAIFVAPVYWISDNAVLTYNVAYLASFVHAGLAMWLLVRRLTGRTDAALIAALAFAFPLLRTSGQHTFLHMQVSGWVPLAFWALHRYADRRRAADALLAAGACVLAILTSLYFAFVLAVPLAYAAIVLVRPRSRQEARQLLAHGLLAGACAAAVLAPVLLRYHGVAETHGFARSAAESARYSADALSYVSVWHQSDLRPFLREESTVVRALFPGAIILALALAVFWRRPAAEAGTPGIGTRVVALWAWGAPLAGLALVAVPILTGNRLAAGTIGLAILAARAALPLPVSTPDLYGRIAALALLLSLGPSPAFDGEAMATSGPHAWLLEWLPGASGLRMPARHGLMVSLALAVLAGYGAMRLLDAWRVSARRASFALAGVAALVVADGYAGPLPVAAFEPFGSGEERRVHAWMAERGPGPVMHLPIANASVQLTFHYATLLHGQPTITGGTDFMPRFAQWLHGEGSVFRAPVNGELALDLLRRLGVRYVLIHRDEFKSPRDAESYEADVLRAARHVRARVAFSTLLAIELNDPLPRTTASAPPPERGPPARIRCRYRDAGRPDPSRDAASIAATWECPAPAGPIAAARWTFDLNRPETWPTRLQVAHAGAAPDAAPLLDLGLTAPIVHAMVTRPAHAPQLDTPLRTRGAATLLVRTWGARAPRSTPPFWLEVWSGD